MHACFVHKNAQRNFDQLKVPYLLWARGPQLFQIMLMALEITWIQVKILESRSTIVLRRCIVSEIIEALSAIRPYIISDRVLE